MTDDEKSIFLNLEEKYGQRIAIWSIVAIVIYLFIVR